MPSKSQDNPEKVADQAVEEVQKTVNAENEQGFIGEAVDPTPRSAYTVAGVTAEEPTPETDEGAAEKAAGEVQKPR